jgi:hypothetical protein
MEIGKLIRMIEDDSESYHNDIVFLKNRMVTLLEREDYMSLRVLHKWVEELILLHHGVVV